MHISTQVHLHNLSICGSELEMFVWLKSVAKTSSHCFVKDGNHKLQRTTETHFWQHGEIASRYIYVDMIIMVEKEMNKVIFAAALSSAVLRI